MCVHALLCVFCFKIYSTNFDNTWHLAESIIASYGTAEKNTGRRIYS